MNALRQHIPNFVDGVDPQNWEFASIDELLRIPWVSDWAGIQDFYRFSMSPRGSDGYPPLLMAEIKDGYEWWVVGFLAEPVDGLPTWEKKEQ